MGINSLGSGRKYRLNNARAVKRIGVLPTKWKTVAIAKPYKKERVRGKFGAASVCRVIMRDGVLLNGGDQA